MILNQYRRSPISFPTQFIMFFSGLRGAIAFALCIGLMNAGDIGAYLFTTTLAVVLFTIVVFGGGTFPLLKLLKIKTKKDIEEEMEALAGVAQPPQKVQNKNILVKWDEDFLFKFFVRNDAQNVGLGLTDQVQLRSKFDKLGGRREFDLAADPGAEHIIINDLDARAYQETDLDLMDLNAIRDEPVQKEQPSVTIRVDLPRAYSRKRSNSVDAVGRWRRNRINADPTPHVNLLVREMMVEPKKAKVYGEALALHYRRVKNLHDIIQNRPPRVHDDDNN